MREGNASWCCAEFGLAFESEHEGVLVTGRKLQDGLMFALASRTSETAPATLASEIRFCPWCGKHLAKHYAARATLLPNVQ